MKKLICVLLFSLGIYLLAGNLVVCREEKAAADVPPKSQAVVSACMPSSPEKGPEPLAGDTQASGQDIVYCAGLEQSFLDSRSVFNLSFRRYYYMAFHLEDRAG